VPYADAMASLWTLCGARPSVLGARCGPASGSIREPQAQHRERADSDAVTVQRRDPADPADPERPAPAPTTVSWPAPPQDAVYQDAPYAPPPVPAAIAPARWSGRRTAAVAALALALTSAGALAAAAATPSGIAGPTEQRGGPGGFGGPGGAPGFQGRQQGQQGAQGVQPGAGTQQQPGTGVPGQGRSHR
jgi:hypothetical protein